MMLGGGGGGGYFGGGGGGASSGGGSGGGGGSSFTFNPTGTTIGAQNIFPGNFGRNEEALRMTAGAPAGAGAVIVTRR